MLAGDSTTMSPPCYLSGRERYLSILRASRHFAKRLSKLYKCGRDYDKFIDLSSDDCAGYGLICRCMYWRQVVLCRSQAKVGKGFEHGVC